MKVIFNVNYNFINIKLLCKAKNRKEEEFDNGEMVKKNLHVVDL